MRSSVSGGVYRAAIGRRALLHGELVGSEMGFSTWISFSGNDDHSVAQGSSSQVLTIFNPFLKPFG